VKSSLSGTGTRGTGGPVWAHFAGRALVDGVFTYKLTTEVGTIGHGFVHLTR